MRNEPSTFLLYDSDCGPCTKFMHVVKRLDVKDKLDPVDLNSSFAAELVKNRLTRDELVSSFHLVIRQEPQEDAQVFSAGSGLIQLLRYLPCGNLSFPLVRRFRPTRSCVRWIYKQATRLRERSDACSIKRKR